MVNEVIDRRDQRRWNLLALATELDYQSREQAYSIVPMSWWSERTAGLTGSDSVLTPLR